MPRYIDADKVIKVIKEANDMYPFLIDENEKCRVCDLIESQPDADVVPKSEVEQWYHEYHAIQDELKQEKMYHRETEKLADRYCAELQTAKSEVERLENALADKARECNMAVDKICLAHREEIRALQEKHEAELAAAKIQFAREIFFEIDMLLTAIYLDDEEGTNFVGVDIQKYHALRKEIHEKLKNRKEIL